MLPAICSVNSQKSQEVKAHIRYILTGATRSPDTNRHNLSALHREAAKATGMGVLTFLPECKQTPEQTHAQPPIYALTIIGAQMA